MKRSLHLFSLLFLVGFCTPNLYAQSVNISYGSPTGLSVCDTALFEIIITNNVQDSIKDVTVEADLPAGLTYILSTVTDATEDNVTNLNVPVFSIPNMGSGDQVTLSFQARTDCGLIDAINAGSLFTNKYTVNWTGGTATETTIPYIIETPLLLITDATNVQATGTKGDVIIRTITFTNTRLGALSKITVTDSNNGGIDISTDYGMVSNATPTNYEIMLTGDDFMNFGDGDEFFELDEVFTLTQIITITDCGFNLTLVNSDIEVSWGCGGDICQTQSTAASINLTPSPDNPDLDFNPMVMLPTDYCGGEPVEQGIEITNNGNLPATNIFFLVNHNNDGVIGIADGSLVMDSSGIMTSLNANYNIPVNFTDCATPGSIFDFMSVTIPSLGPGETIKLKWQIHVCAVGCGSPFPQWFYNYNYNLSCPTDEEVDGAGSNATGGIPILMIDSITYQIGVPLEDDMTYVMNYDLTSQIIADSSGSLVLEFFLPCGLSWAGSPMVLAGNAPVNTDIVNSPAGGQVVTLTYEMPLNATNVNADFTITWNCEPDCVFKPPCDIVPVTNCPQDEICTGAGFPQVVGMQVITTINLDTLSSNQCGIQECQEFELVYDCPADSICWDTIVGWLDYEMDFYRTSLGLPDNDDDRFADGSGELNFNNIRRDRAIAGDSLRTEFEGVVVMDIPGGQLQNGAITVSFEAHTADDGLDGGQALGFDTSWPLMTEEFGFKNLGANLKIVDASTGEIYECALGTPATFDTLYAKLTLPNTRPETILDEVLFMTFTYSISPAALSAMGCDIPADFVYEEGDSLIFNSDHRVLYNVIEFGSPRIVNLRTGTSVGFFNNSGPYQLDPFVCNCQSLPWQLTGYRFLFSSGIYDMPPCATSDEPGGTRFDFLLGTGNFFPFEFRNFAIIDDWLLGVDPSITLLNSELLFLRLQSQPPITLYTSQNLDATPSGMYWDVDLDEFQEPNLDEGFSIRFVHEWEMPCTINTNLPLNIHSIISTQTIPENNPMDTITTGFGAFRPQRPFMALETDNPAYVSLDNTAEWDLELSNLALNFNEPVPNVWMTVSSSSPDLTNFQIIDLTTGLPVPLVDGLFQLGDFILGSNNYQLIADNNSCDMETVTVTYGWNCEPYDGVDLPCWQGALMLTVTSPPGELEMALTNPITPIDLCDTVPYHTIDIFNAQVGTVYEVKLDVLLPDGFSIAPGTAQISFPTGSGWINIPDPTDLGGGAVQWDLSQISNDFAEEGLKGFNQAPNHSISIRFKGLTECGFIASSQLVFTASGTQNCELPTNTLSKAGDPINITGVTPPYVANIDVVTNAPPFVACGDDYTFSVNMSADGVTLENDSIFVLLPNGITYVPGSYVPNPNADSNEPFIDNSNGNQTLKWAIKDGLSPNTPIAFELTMTGFGLLECDVEHIIQVKAVQKQEAVCVADGTLCEVLAETGSTLITLQTTHPDFELQNFTINTTGGNVTFSLDVTNDGEGTEHPLVVDFYVDNDGNGVPSAGDELLQTQTITDPIGMGGLVNIQGTFDIEYEQICDLIAFIDADQNCSCEDEILSPVDNILNQLAPITVCSGQDQEVGIAPVPGNNYTWSPPNHLNPTNTSLTTFNYVNDTDAPQQFNYALFDDNGEGCIINSTITLTVPPVPGIVSNDTTICQGSTITLEASLGASYDWTGEGISDPTLQNQTVTLNDPGNYDYSVNIIDNNGCSGADVVSINVIEAPTQDSIIRICEGTAVDVFGQIITQNATVFGTLPNPNGQCDILVKVDVIVQGVVGDSDLIVCKGDSVEVVPGVFVGEFDGLFIDTISTNLPNCDSVHTYIIVPVDTVDMTVDDFACVPNGDDFVLSNQLPNIYSYDWEVILGTGTLDCDTCSNPIFTPAGDSTVYQVTATTADGCSSSFMVNVQVLPECGVQALDGMIPNAFTPDGDLKNDLFGVVPDPRLEKLFDGVNNSINLSVWNRWGQMVFEGASITERWDGNFENEISQSEVYVYLIEVQCGDETKQIKGDVTLLR